MDKEQQEEAVRKLIAATKPGKPVIIVYRNPNTLIEHFVLPLRKLKQVWKKLNSRLVSSNEEAKLYAFAYPVDWWDRFKNEADIEIFPWRSFYSHHQKVLIPNNKLGTKIFDILYNLEENFPNFFVNNFQYPMIVLRKKESMSMNS